MAFRALGIAISLLLSLVSLMHAGGSLPLECPDRDCLIQASRDCTPARWTKNLAEDSILAQLGYTVTGTGLDEIVGWDGDRCVFYMWANYQDVRLSAVAIQQRLAAGRTPEEIEQIRADYERQAKTQNEGICRFLPGDLTVLLEHLNEQFWSTSDYANGQCHGSMFD